VPYAGFWRRVGGFVIDYVVVLTASWIAAALAAGRRATQIARRSSKTDRGGRRDAGDASRYGAT
jgi:hypothetical protein